MKRPSINDKELKSEHLRQTLDQAGWLLIEDRFRMMLQQYREELEQDLTHEETVKVRGKIRALKSVLDVPGILKTELAM